MSKIKNIPHPTERNQRIGGASDAGADRADRRRGIPLDPGQGSSADAQRSGRQEGRPQRPARTDRNVKKGVAAAEGKRADVADQLKDVEQEISQTQRDLHKLGTQRDRLQGALKDLAGQSHELQGAPEQPATATRKTRPSPIPAGQPDRCACCSTATTRSQTLRATCIIWRSSAARAASCLSRSKAPCSASGRSPPIPANATPNWRRSRPNRRASTTSCSPSVNNEAGARKISVKISKGAKSATCTI